MTRGSPGYTLLEAMVAFAVMAMVLSVLIPASTRLGARAATAEAVFLAQEVALSELALLGLARPLAAGAGTRDGWRVETALRPGPMQTVEIEVTVRRATGGPVLARLSERRPAP